MHEHLLFPSKIYSINTKYRYVSRIHSSALYTKIFQRIVHRFSGTYVSEDLQGLLEDKNKDKN